MDISKLFEQKKVVFSFEIFPPKTTSGVETIYKTLEELKGLKPDFISVTYGAGGSTTENRTCELSSLVKNQYGIESVAHLTCISSSKEEIDLILRDLNNEGISNILALRGDVPENSTSRGEFNYATELISHIKQKNKFNIAAACYPEGHIQDMNVVNEVRNMKNKVESGATHFISQLFFENKLYYEFLEKVQCADIKAPIQAGIMPVTNKKQIERIAKLSGATIPNKFLKIMDKYEHNPEALRDAGIAYAVEQIVDLISSGANGIHLYTMNNPYVAKRITENLGSIISTINNQ
ncbi:MAG: methylenetetrahydrofolate reductase [NAD(P)H] [Clostridium sp.]